MTPSQQTQAYNILVVDDNPMNIRLLATLLEEEHYKVRPAPNGIRALSVLEKHSIDLILLDIRMPEMDGYEVCQRVKFNPKTKDIPIIFVSALGETFDKLKAFSAGGVDYVTKPFEEKEVIARIRTQLDLMEQKKRLQILAEITFEGILLHCYGEIIDVNPALEAMLGYKREDLIGTNAFDLLAPESIDPARIHMEKGSEHPIELKAVKKTGIVLPVDIQVRNIVWQGRAARVIAIRDMSWRTFFKQEQHAIDIVLDSEIQLEGLVGRTDIMKKAFQSILRAAVSDAPVLINGETGTGKELTAQALFSLNESYKKSFIPVNCASIPNHLFESLFFGHKKGAFTGADKDHDGFFKQAHNGILFLDEVGELSLEMQAKLLRVLNDFTYTPVGSKTPQKADIRLIAATNRDLTTLMDQKRFRSDFFHRLYVLNIDLPPLRLRKEDIPDLITHFFISNPLPDNKPPNIPADILEKFNAYDWPGNVRELFNELQRFTATGEINLSGSLPEKTGERTQMPDIEDNLPLVSAIEQFEQVYIPHILKLNNGHKGKTAEILNIDRKTLYRKLKKFGIA